MMNAVRPNAPAPMVRPLPRPEVVRGAAVAAEGTNPAASAQKAAAIGGLSILGLLNPGLAIATLAGRALWNKVRPQEATAAGALVPAEPRVRPIPLPEPTEPAGGRPRPMPGPGLPGGGISSDNDLNRLNARLERLYDRRDALAEDLAQARIHAKGELDPAARVAANAKVAALQAKQAALDTRITSLEDLRRGIMDGWAWAHNDGPGKLPEA
jgi:hypothetical protein